CSHHHQATGTATSISVTMTTPAAGPSSVTRPTRTKPPAAVIPPAARPAPVLGVAPVGVSWALSHTPTPTNTPIATTHGTVCGATTTPIAPTTTPTAVAAVERARANLRASTTITGGGRTADGTRPGRRIGGARGGTPSPARPAAARDLDPDLDTNWFVPKTATASPTAVTARHTRLGAAARRWATDLVAPTSWTPPRVSWRGQRRNQMNAPLDGAPSGMHRARRNQPRSPDRWEQRV